MLYKFTEPEHGVQIDNLVVGQTENDPHFYEIGNDKDGNFYWLARHKTPEEAQEGLNLLKSALDRENKIYFYESYKGNLRGWYLQKKQYTTVHGVKVSVARAIYLY